MAAQQTRRARKKIKEVRNYLGRVVRNIETAVAQGQIVPAALEVALGKAQIVQKQTLNPNANEKLYSWRAPEVECIAKGRASKKYEFGCKASFASTNKSNFIVGAVALHGKPYDGHTLGKVLSQIQNLIGIKPNEVQVVQGLPGS
jgi:IS5 family transposase